MKATGIVRKVDELGRIVVPMEIRRNLGIGIGDPVEFWVDGQQVIMQKYDTAAGLEQLLDRMEKELILKSDLQAPALVAALLAKVDEIKAIANQFSAQGDNDGRPAV